ncbi:MAG: MgtC/SapB family protein [Verrucomicrobiota bacterium]|nr:MgtC/SapB family protein [Verrucomicrobiota bacterium]
MAGLNTVFTQLAVSLGLGLLLGLQRERAEASIAGIRTFPLIALFGTVCAQMGQAFGGWVVGAGLLALAAIVVVANAAKLKAGHVDPGMTTEISALLLYALGGYLVVGHMAVAVVIGGAMALLLHLKEPMHRFAEAVGDRDMRAIMQFVLLTLVILPVLPRRDVGPYGVWNPFEIWLMVVLIVGISLGGYVAYKLFGARAGTLVGGLLGGLISSTATTVSYARRSRENAEIAGLAALVIMIASCVSLARIIVEIAAVARGAFAQLAPPLLAMLALCGVIAAAMYLAGGRQQTPMPGQKNPAELKPALVFGGLYALILLAVAAAREHFGSAGLYTVGILSGLTDVDAITLSSSQMAAEKRLDPDLAWRTILIAAMSNFGFKLATVALLGSRALALRVALAFALALAGGGLILWLWPAPGR